MVRKVLVVVVVGAIAAIVAIGCGGDSETVTVTETATTSKDETAAESDLVPVEALSPKTVEKCLEHGGAIVFSSEELNPGEIINATGIFAMSGDSGARIGIVVTLKPFITKRLARELAEEGEYDINVTPSEDAVVVFDAKATPSDEALASECSEVG